MAAHSKIKGKQFIKLYYQALRAKKSLSEFAAILGCTPGAAFARVKYFRTKKNIPLPPLPGAFEKTKAAVKHIQKAHAPAPKRPTPINPAISAEAYIRLWQTSETMEEVLEKSGLSQEIARGKAAKLRKIGVPLKKFDTRGTKLDVAALIALAKSLAPNPDLQRIADETANASGSNIPPHKPQALPQ